jgi:hypothetical protein
MNKSTLIDLLELTVGVTGDVEFSDTGRTLLDIAQSADLNSHVICHLLTEANAIYNVIYEENCFPFFPVRTEEGDYLLLSDFDGKVNLKPCSNVVMLMIMVRAVENVFSKLPGQLLKPLCENDYKLLFDAYAQQFEVGKVISPIERSETMILEILTDTLVQKIEAVSQSTLTDENDSALSNEAIPTEQAIDAEDVIAPVQPVKKSEVDLNDPMSIFKI